MAGTTSSPSTSSTSSEMEPHVAVKPKKVHKPKWVIPLGMTMDSCLRDLKAATNPEERTKLNYFKRVLNNRDAAKRSRNTKTQRLAYLERHTLQQQALINNLQARVAQTEAHLQQTHNSGVYWQQRAQQAQYNLPSLSNTLAHLPVSSEHVLLPSHPGWGTIDPRQVNSTPATFTQEPSVDLDAAIANFAEAGHGDHEL